jgi:predicted Zn-dependent peptidase
MSIADVTPNKLANASKALAALFLDHGNFEEKQFQAERKIILHELADIDDDPREKASEMLAQCLFKTHPARRAVGGFPKTVKQISLEQLEQIYRQHYAPQNTLLILTGNFTDKDVKAAVQDFNCPATEKNPAKEKRALETGASQRTVIKKKAGLCQTYLCVGARTVHSGHPDTPAIDLLSVILGAGASSRLFIELREKWALTYDVGAMHVDGSDFGYFGINCAVKQNRLKEAQRLIFEEFSKLRTKRVPEAELNKGKDMILGDIFRGVDNAQSCPEILTLMEIQFGDENALLDYVNQVRVVTAIEVRDVANKYLQEDQLATAVLTPKN